MRKRLSFKGETLEYDLLGSGLPVMLVHGFTEDRTIWYPLLEGIEKKFQWILPDLPGSGESPFNKALPQLADFAGAVDAIVSAENIPALVLIGHSMGGYISLAFAEKYPEKILGLGLFHSGSYADSTEKKEARDKNIRFIQKNGAALFVEQAIPGLYSDHFKSGHPEEIYKQVEKYSTMNADSLILYLEGIKRRPATTTVLQTITKPVLFIMGEEDRAIPVNDVLEQCHLPSISYIHLLTRTAHMGMIENTKLTRSWLDRFIEEIHS